MFQNQNEMQISSLALYLCYKVRIIEGCLSNKHQNIYDGSDHEIELYLAASAASAAGHDACLQVERSVVQELSNINSHGRRADLEFVVFLFVMYMILE